MTWLIKIPDGPVVESDDFTLDDLGRIEKDSDTFWSIANPLRSAAVARAFLKTAYRRAGMDETEVDALPMKYLKSVFDFRADDEPAGEAETDPTPGRKARTSRNSSGGARRSTTGPPVPLDSNASATSSA